MKQRIGRARPITVLGCLLALLLIPAAAIAQTHTPYSAPPFSNRDAIVMPEFLIGPSTPYPSTIRVTGQTATVFKATVTIRGMTHSYPDDLDILLVGPQGQNVLLMSDVGSGFDASISNVTLTFDDDASEQLPDGDQIFSGTYRPSNSGRIGPEYDNFAAPAPAKPHGSALSVFEGSNPNGDWRLYVMDDSPEDTGFFEGGWTLNLMLIEPIAEVGVGLVGSPNPVALTSNLTYSISVTNYGLSPATGLSMINPLPAGTLLNPDSLDQNLCLESNGVVHCDLEPLAPGAVAHLSYRIVVTEAGLVTNRVSISADQVDYDVVNNSASTVTLVNLIDDLEVTATVSPSSVLLDQPLVYTATVTNHGPYDATGVMLTNLLPAQVQFLSATASSGDCFELGGIVRCDVGDLPVGAGAELVITGQALELGPITNLVFVGGEESDIDPASNVAETMAEVVPSANLLVAQLDNRDPIIVGESVAYSMMVSNQGPSAATSVSLLDTLPEHAQLLEVTASQGSCTNEGNQVRCDLGELQVAAQVMVDVSVRIVRSGTATNSISVNSEHGDPDTSDNSALETTEVDPAADLIVRMFDEPDSAQVGALLAYSLMVSNAGPDIATSIVLKDILPSSVELISLSTSQGGCTNNGAEITCDLEDLPGQEMVLVSINVLPTTTGIITNRASVSALEFDPDPSNNAAEESTSTLIGIGHFTNGEAITIPDQGTASLYPSTIQVAGVTARVDRVSVTLHQLSHTYADDLDLLLVGPSGQTAMLWSDAGGSSRLEEVTVSLDPLAGRVLPDESAIASASYRPMDYDSESDEFAEPAPVGPYLADLSIFQDTDVNGEWSLYVMDDFPKDSGNLAGGWSLSFGTTEVLNDVGLVLATEPAPVAVGSNLVYRIEVGNQGPGLASEVRVTNHLPSSVDWVEVTSSAGTCTHESGKVACDLGTLAGGKTATVEITVRPQSAGTLVFSSSVVALETDVAFGNNSAFTTVDVLDPPVIVVPPFSLTVTNGGLARFHVLAEGSPSLQYQWYRNNGERLIGRTNATLSLPNATLAEAGLYTVRIENAAGAITSDPVVLTVLQPVSIVQHPASQTAFTGGPAAFQIVAAGDAPLTYQWFFNGNPLPGRTNAALLLESVDLDQAGVYEARVANSLNAVSTEPAELTVLTADFGDAPVADTAYPTLLAANGARHLIVEGIHLGSAVDMDPDGRPGSLADGDDVSGIDDDDGVRFLTPLIPGLEASVEVVASQSGLLDAWIDFGENGDWNDAGDQIFTNAVLAPGTNVLAFVVPAESAAVNRTYARFRFSTAGGLSPEGQALDGEVEDYAVNVVRQADLAVSLTYSPEPATVNFNLVYEIAVTNLGPLEATGVRAVASMPPNSLFLGLSSTQGSCSSTPIPNCNLGDLALGEGAVMTLIVAPLAEGLVSNEVSVSSLELDPEISNNLAVTETRVLRRARILSPPVNRVASVGDSVTFSVLGTGTLVHYQWRFNDVDLPGETNTTFVLPSAQLEDQGSYSVVVSNELNVVVSAPAQLTVFVPPTFTMHPSSQTQPYGSTVLLSGLAQGTEPIAYQWLFNGAPLSGKTNRFLSLLDLVPAQDGTYVLRASNGGGQALSQPAVLTLTGMPVIVEQPASQTNLAGSDMTFRLRAAGTRPLSVQWYYNGDILLENETNAVLALDNIQLANAGIYHATVTNLAGVAVSEMAELQVLEMDFGDAPQPGFATTLSANGARHRVVNGIHLGAAIDFEPDGQPESNATGDDAAGDDDEDGVFFSQPWPVGQITALQVVASTQGLLNAWVDFNGNGSWTDVGDRIFADQLLQPGTNQISFLVPSSATARDTHARFRFSTAGGLAVTGEAMDGEVEDYAVVIRQRANLVLTRAVTPNPVAVGAGTTILLNVFNQGPALATRTILTNSLPPDFTLTNIARVPLGACSNLNGTVVCDLGTMAVGQSTFVALEGFFSTPGVYRNEAFVGAVELDESPANNAVAIDATVLSLPSILAQPASLTLTNGSTAAFTVSADGGMPLNYQWRRAGAELPGQTNATLTIEDVQAAHAGDYTVQVGNPVGVVVSDLATLTVRIAAGILEGPRDTEVLAGSEARFDVLAEGDEPIGYQWSFNGSPVAGATNGFLIITNAQKTLAGSYQVTVSNPIGTVLSDPAQLTVWEADFGDAPEPGFQTVLTNNAAHHLLAPGVFLGATVDFETDGQPSASALGDDATGVDDEDGVIFQSLLQSGQSARVRVTASTEGFLNAWIDFDGDGDWSDPEDQIFTDRALVAGFNTLTFTLPSRVLPGDSYARFRFSTTGGDGIGGRAMDGEVEDHRVQFSSSSDLAVLAMTSPSTGSVGAPMLTSVLITNHGPGVATGVVLRDVVPAGWSLQSALASQGTCSGQSNVVTCDVGTIPAGGVVWALIESIPMSEGLFTERLTVASASTDPFAGNNEVTVETMVQTLPLIVKQPRSVGVAPGQTAYFTVEAVGAPPLGFQWKRDGADLPGETGTSLTVEGVQAEDLGVYEVVVSNPNGAATSDPAPLYLVDAPVAVTLPAENVGATTVTLAAEVIPNGLLTVAWFEWGRSTNYQNVTYPGSAGRGDQPVRFVSTLSDLMPETTYHYRVVATNALGLVTGQNQTFTTTTIPPLLTAISKEANGTVRIEFTGAEAQPYEVRASRDFVTWTTLGPATELGGGLYEFTDADGANFDFRFYQVLLP